MSKVGLSTRINATSQDIARSALGQPARHNKGRVNRCMEFTAVTRWWRWTASTTSAIARWVCPVPIAPAITTSSSPSRLSQVASSASAGYWQRTVASQRPRQSVSGTSARAESFIRASPQAGGRSWPPRRSLPRSRAVPQGPRSARADPWPRADPVGRAHRSRPMDRVSPVARGRAARCASPM